MARPKSSKAGPRIGDDASAVPRPLAPAPPVVPVESVATAPVVPVVPVTHIAPPPVPARKSTTRKPVRKEAAAVHDEKAGLNGVRHVVDEISHTLGGGRSGGHRAGQAVSSSPFASLPLPGAFSPAVDTRRTLRAVVAAAVTSLLLSAGGRFVLAWIALSLAASTTTATASPLTHRYLASQTWTSWTSHLSTATAAATASAAAPGLGAYTIMLAVRILKFALAWGPLSNIASLDVLAHGPIVHLLSSFYNVPLSAVLLSEGLDTAADLVAVGFWRRQADADADAVVGGGDEKNEEGEEAAGGVGGGTYGGSAWDPVSFAVSSVFAAALYSFTYVQACRFFLPATLVVHFLGIATVEPARTHALSAAAKPVLGEVLSAVFLSVPAVLLSAVCGVAARTFVFGTGAAGQGSAAQHPHGAYGTRSSLARTPLGLYARAVALRTAALALAVGVSVAARCLLGIQGVDTVGAAAFAAVWTVAPLLVGTGLGLAGV